MKLYIVFILSILLSCSEINNFNVPKEFIESITKCIDKEYKSIRTGNNPFEKNQIIKCDYYLNGLVSSEKYYDLEYNLEYELFYSWNSNSVNIILIDWTYSNDKYKGWIESEKKLKWNFK